MRELYRQINMINLIEMSQTSNNQLTSEPHSSRKAYEQNPISAVNKLKSVNDNIETMKNRYLVLRRRDEYSKYKTLDLSKKLNFHHLMHQRLQQERDSLRNSLDQIRETSEIRHRSQTIRKQIEEGIHSAKRKVYRNNIRKYGQVMKEAIEHKQLIHSKIQSELSLKRERTRSLKRLQEQEKQIIEKKIQERRSRIIANKSIDSLELKQQSAQGELLIQKLQKHELQMLSEASKSIESSRLVSQKFTEIMRNLPSFRSKKSEKSERLSFLPTIRQKNANSSTLQVIMV